MALSKTSLRWIFWIVIAVIIIALLVYFFRCSIFSNLGSCIEDPNETNTPVPPGSPTPKWVPESFPLNVGMFGPKIKNLQKALGISQDGRFGTVETLPALQAKGYNVPLSLTDYDKIVNPPATGGGTNFQAVKNGLGTAGKNFSGGVTGYMAGPNEVYKFDFYTNGRVIVYDSKNNEKARGTYSNGGKTIVSDKGATFNGNSVALTMQQIANALG